MKMANLYKQARKKAVQGQSKVILLCFATVISPTKLEA
jgi:hypothetical protein